MQIPSYFGHISGQTKAIYACDLSLFWRDVELLVGKVWKRAGVKKTVLE